MGRKCHAGTLAVSTSLCMLTDTYQPVIPGHEITGHVVRVGAAVSEFKVGQRVGVGYVLHIAGLQALNVYQGSSLLMLQVRSLQYG